MSKLNTLLFYFGFLVLFSCNNRQEKKKSTDTNTPERSQSESQRIDKHNFAVVWQWATDDSELVSKYTPQISKELTLLWKRDKIQNAYFDAESEVDKLDYFPNITFFLKAPSEAEAKAILNRLTVVTKGIATYKLYPVGTLWLDRKTDQIDKKGVSKSFVTVWKTLKSPLHGKAADELLKRQSDTVIELWNKGIIENVYFDMEGTYQTNEKTDFVFFVNANSEMRARSICETLPFYKEKLATYNIAEVGVFWMGKYEEN